MLQVGFWEQMIGLTMLGFFAYLTYLSINNNKDAFSSKNINHSFKTMGLLALILIAFVSMLFILLPPGQLTGAAQQQKNNSQVTTKKGYRTL